MIYTMTPEQHAQIVDALELPSLKTVSMLIKRDAALAMLKAMKPRNATRDEKIVNPGFYEVRGWK